MRWPIGIIILFLMIELGCGQSWSEKHENPAGYDNPSDWLGSELEPDPNYPTSSVTGAPVDWGNECSQYVDAEVEWPVYFDVPYPTTNWVKWEIIIEAEGLSNLDSCRLLLLSASTLNACGNIYLYQDGSGNLSLLARVNHDGTANPYYSLSSQYLSLDSPFVLEFMWDADNDVWGWRLDDVDQPNDQDGTDPVESDGVLSSTHELDFVTGQTGQTSATSETITFYLDNIGSDETDWIGSEAGTSIPSWSRLLMLNNLRIMR